MKVYKTMDLQSFKNALSISIIYLTLGLLWIYYSDAAVASIASNSEQITLLQTYKGWFFIFSTTIVLFFVSYRFLHITYLEYTHHIEEQKNAQQQLIQKDTLLKTIINSSPDAIFVKDLEGKYILFNEGASNIVGVLADRVIGNTDDHLFTPKDAVMIREMDRKIIANGIVSNHEETVTISSGETKVFWVTKGPIQIEEETPFGIFGISRDITEAKKYEQSLLNAKERLDLLAHHDPLTNLPNRLSLIETLSLKTAEINQTPFSLLFLDLDEFQQINDSYGHRFGDNLLIEVAHLLQSIFPPNTYIARTGGDEFLVITPCHDNDPALRTKLIHLIDGLNHPFNIDNIDVYTSASIGIAQYPQDATSTENLLQCADAAMYKAKRMGKNTFYFYSVDLIENALQRTTMTGSLRKVLENGDLKLVYQPQVDVKTERIIGYEALLRWETPDGFIPPSTFIPICEESGLILDIGKFVLMEGCQTALKWKKSGIINGLIAINVSARQLTHPDFISTLDHIINETQCPPSCIELEITESSILENPEKMISLLRTIKEKGFKLSIDDFGTGYSSLSYLKHLPIDKLKIDISFIRNITQEPKNQTIVKTIIALAKGLGMEVLAEGVESTEELEFLRENGVDSVQGFYYYKPISIEAIETLFLD